MIINLTAHEKMALLSIAANHKAAGKHQRAYTVERASHISPNSTPEEQAAAVKRALLIIAINNPHK